MSSSAISNMTDIERYRDLCNSYAHPLLSQFKWRQVSVGDEPNLAMLGIASLGLNGDEDTKYLSESSIQSYLHPSDNNIARTLMARKTRIHEKPMSAHWDKEKQVFISSFEPSQLTLSDITHWHGAALSTGYSWPQGQMLAVTSPETARRIKSLVHITPHGILTATDYFFQLIGHPLMSDGNIFWLDPKMWEWCCTFNMPCWDFSSGHRRDFGLTNYAAFKCTQINPSWMRIKTERVHVSGFH